MGRKSTKENKNIYQTSREGCGLSRDKAAEIMETVSPDRIERIENGWLPHPDEILSMSKCYKNPSLCNYYCSHECPIGQEYVPALEIKDLPRIALEALSSLNTLAKEKDRLIEIAADGEITSDELTDFKRIENQLSEISIAADSLKLWIQHAEAGGRMPEE